MELRKYTIGGVYSISDHYGFDDNKRLQRQAANNENRHYYMCIGTSVDTARSISKIQFMCITSLKNINVTCELPVIINYGKISFLVPYSISEFIQQDIEKSYIGSIGGFCTIQNFVDGCMNIYLDKVIYQGSNKEINEAASIFHDTYCKQFYDRHKKTYLEGKNIYYVPRKYDGSIMFEDIDEYPEVEVVDHDMIEDE